MEEYHVCSIIRGGTYYFQYRQLVSPPLTAPITATTPTSRDEWNDISKAIDKELESFRIALDHEETQRDTYQPIMKYSVPLPEIFRRNVKIKNEVCL